MNIIDNVLDSIKVLIPIPKEDDSFDDALISFINTELSILSQIGVKTKVPFYIENKDESWDKYLDLNDEILPMIVQYIYLKVKSVFDPPSNSFLVESIKNNIQELEWRIKSHIDEEGG